MLCVSCHFGPLKQCTFYYFTRNSRLIFLLKYVMVYSAVFYCIYTKCLVQNLIIKENGKTLSSTVLFEGLREDWLYQLSHPHKIKSLLTYLLTDNGWLVGNDASTLVGH